MFVYVCVRSVYRKSVCGGRVSGCVEEECAEEKESVCGSS